jgi:hypothetical protein
LNVSSLTGNVWRYSWLNLGNSNWVGHVSSSVFTENTIVFASVGEASPDDSGKVLGNGTITINQVCPNEGIVNLNWTIAGASGNINILIDFLVFPGQE